MTDNEIIKALECMLGKYSIGELIDCKGCFFETSGLCCENASDGIAKAALDLITRQKAEIENLNKDLADTIALNHEERKGLKAEVERLNYENLQMIASIKHLKDEAVNEFEEELWFKVFNDDELNTESFARLTKHIDDTKKEMVGDV